MGCFSKFLVVCIEEFLIISKKSCADDHHARLKAVIGCRLAAKMTKWQLFEEIAAIISRLMSIIKLAVKVGKGAAVR
jgi:hypothetical protein